MKKQRELAQSLAQWTSKEKNVYNEPEWITTSHILEEGLELSNDGKRSSYDKFKIIDFQKDINGSEGNMMTVNPEFFKEYLTDPCVGNTQSSIELCEQCKNEKLGNLVSQKEESKEDYKTNIQSNVGNLTADCNEDNFNMDKEKVAYLINLRHEFENMPVIMFYNLVHLWQVQQADLQNEK